MHEWIAFEKLEPFGDRRGDWQAATICAMLANIAVAKGRTKKRFTPADFLLKFDEGKKEDEKPVVPEWKNLQAVARNYAAMANAMVRADAKKLKQREARRRARK